MTNTNIHLPLPILPLSAPNSINLDAADFICALVGSSSVNIGRVQSEPVKRGLFFHPELPFININDSNNIGHIISSRKRAWSRFIVFLGALMIFCCALSIGVLGSHYARQFFDKKIFSALSASPTWSIIDVVPKGVLITVNDGPFVFIAVGSNLPNGDSVVSVSHEQRKIYLASSTVILRGAATPEMSILKDTDD